MGGGELPVRGFGYVVLSLFHRFGLAFDRDIRNRPGLAQWQGTGQLDRLPEPALELPGCGNGNRLSATEPKDVTGNSP